MIEDRVRELVAEVQAVGDTWTPEQRIDAIGEMDAAIGMLQAQQSVEAAAYVDQRRVSDEAAGRDAVTEPPWTTNSPSAPQLVDDHPVLLAVCLDEQVAQSAAKHIVTACEPLDSEQRRSIDAELAELACELTRG